MTLLEELERLTASWPEADELCDAVWRLQMDNERLRRALIRAENSVLQMTIWNFDVFAPTVAQQIREALQQEP